MPAPPVLSAARRGLRRYVGDLRASQSFLAGEVSHSRWLDLGQFRWRNVDLGRAVRAGFGVLIPLVVGIATGHAEYGSFAALGALPAGTVSFQGVTRTRVLLVAVAAGGMAISTFVGATTSASAPWVLVPVIAVWCYVAGVCSALGPAAIAVSLQWPVAVLIASAIPLDPAQAGVRAALVLAGGLWQGALVVSSWAFSRGSAERTAMAESYATLSRYAAELAAGHGEPPPPAALPGTDALRDPNPLLRSAARQHLLDLMEEAERIRTTLAGVAGGIVEAGSGGGGAADSGGEGSGGGRSGDEGSGGGRSEHEGSGGGRGAALEAASRTLGEIAEALRGRPSQRGQHLDWAREWLSPDAPAGGWSSNWAAEALNGQLRSAIRIAERLNDAEPSRRPGPGAGAVPRPTVRLPAQDLLVTLRASLGPSTEAGRHALRLAVVAGLGEVIVQAAGLPHGYWVTLTILIVLRPDYSSTIYRGLQRAAGTVVGAGLGLATVLLGHVGSWALLIVIGACLVAAFAVFTVNYLFYAIFLTDFVVVLLALEGLPADQTAVYRLIGTGVGTGLALLAYILWPTWERTSASEKFAHLIQAQARFSSMMLRAYSRPASEDASRARSRKLDARRSRVDAERSADRLADEPNRPPVTREFGQALVSAGHGLALAALALEAAVGAHHAELRRERQLVLAGAPGVPGAAARAGGAAAGTVPDTAAATAAVPDEGTAAQAGTATDEPDPLQPHLDRLADMVTQAAAQLTESLHRLRPPGPLPPLREVQTRLRDAPGCPAALASATDSLVDALNTAADILRRYLTPPT
jgi:uncharacterized membrane protein YccC